jgi:hypothetical protein
VTKEVLVMMLDGKGFAVICGREWRLFFDHEVRRRDNGGPALLRAQ